MIYQYKFSDEIRDGKFSKDSKRFTVGLKDSWFYVYGEDCL